MYECSAEVPEGICSTNESVPAAVAPLCVQAPVVARQSGRLNLSGSIPTCFSRNATGDFNRNSDDHSGQHRAHACQSLDNSLVQAGSLCPNALLFIATRIPSI